MAAASKSDSQICFRSNAWIEKEKALHTKCVPKKTAHPNLASAFLFQSSGSNGKLWWVQSSHVAQAVLKGKWKVEKKKPGSVFCLQNFPRQGSRWHWYLDICYVESDDSSSHKKKFFSSNSPKSWVKPFSNSSYVTSNFLRRTLTLRPGSCKVWRRRYILCFLK